MMLHRIRRNNSRSVAFEQIPEDMDETFSTCGIRIERTQIKKRGGGSTWTVQKPIEIDMNVENQEQTPAHSNTITQEKQQQQHKWKLSHKILKEHKMLARIQKLVRTIVNGMWCISISVY